MLPPYFFVKVLFLQLHYSQIISIFAYNEGIMGKVEKT